LKDRDVASALELTYEPASSPARRASAWPIMTATPATRLGGSA